MARAAYGVFSTLDEESGGAGKRIGSTLMGLFSRDRIDAKTPEQLARMRVAGLLVGRTLELLRESVRPGMTTLELDTLA